MLPTADLGTAPFDGSAPIIMYGPDCGKPIPDGGSGSAGLGAKVGDAPRVEIAKPADVSGDPFLTNWVKTQPGPVTFEGTPCSFPGRVWKSKVGNYWNMLCALDGKTPWARFTSSDPSLMKWKKADDSFTQGKDPGGAAGALFHSAPPLRCQHRSQLLTRNACCVEIPNAPASGPTHMINGPGTGSDFLLGTYDSKKEIMTITDDKNPPTVTGSYGWAASGNDGPDPDSDTGRLITAAWVTSRPSAISLIRDLHWDPKSGQLVSSLAPEYAKLHNATFSGAPKGSIKAGASTPIPVPAAAAGTVDIMYSFTPDKATSGFGLSVRSRLSRHHPPLYICLRLLASACSCINPAHSDADIWAGAQVKSGAVLVTVTEVDATSDGFNVTLNFTDSNSKPGFNHGG